MRIHDIKVTTAADPLITTAGAKTHLRVTNSNEDGYIDGLVLAATKWCENYAQRQFLAASYTARFSRFPASSAEPVYLPLGQLTSITSIKYSSVGGAVLDTTWTSSLYQHATYAEPGYVLPVDGESWPDVENGQVEGAEIIWVCGWPEITDIPEDILHAVKLAMSFLYENRSVSLNSVSGQAAQLELPVGCKALLDMYSLRELV